MWKIRPRRSVACDDFLRPQLPLGFPWRKRKKTNGTVVEFGKETMEEGRYRYDDDKNGIERYRLVVKIESFISLEYKLLGCLGNSDGMICGMFGGQISR